jgi:DNA-directed RNA polymerase subunit M/transcription elongation factor TFIIS
MNPTTCSKCGSPHITVCVNYLRRDIGDPEPSTRYTCGCGNTGLLNKS